MAVKFERAKDGTLIAVDTKTNEKIGKIVTLGDCVNTKGTNNSKSIDN